MFAAAYLSLCFVFPSVLNISKNQADRICRLEPVINKAAKDNNIDPNLLASIIYVESSYYPRAVSRANACGLTQVIPKWTGGPETGHKKYTCSQLKEPRLSIRVGAQILRYIMSNYTNGNEDQALCMYNAGTVCLKKKNLYKTSLYVKKVRRIYDKITNVN